jgi:hypothetical protein
MELRGVLAIWYRTLLSSVVCVLESGEQRAKQHGGFLQVICFVNLQVLVDLV